MMKVLQMEVGSLGTNCYIAYCENTKKAVIIDPGGDAARILAAVNREGLTVEAIINTHGHADHVLANVKVKEATGAPLWIHSADADMLGSGLAQPVGLSGAVHQLRHAGSPAEGWRGADGGRFYLEGAAHSGTYTRRDQSLG